MKKLFDYQQKFVDITLYNYKTFYPLVGDKVQSLMFGAFMGTGTGKTLTMLHTFKALKEAGYFDKSVIISEKVILSDKSGFEDEALAMGFSVENYTRGKDTTYKALASKDFSSDIILINKDKVNLKNGKDYLTKISNSIEPSRILFILDEGVYYKERKNKIVEALTSPLFKKSHKILSTGTPVPNRTESLVNLISNLGVLDFLFPKKQRENEAYQKLVANTIYWFKKYHNKEIPTDYYYKFEGQTAKQQLQNYEVYKNAVKMIGRNRGVETLAYKPVIQGLQKVRHKYSYNRSYSEIMDVKLEDITGTMVRDYHEGFKLKEDPTSELAKRCATFMYVYTPVNRPLDVHTIEKKTGVDAKRVQRFLKMTLEDTRNSHHEHKKINVGLQREQNYTNPYKELFGEARRQAIYDIIKDGRKTIIYTWNTDHKDLLVDYFTHKGIKIFAYKDYKKDAKWKEMFEQDYQCMVVGYQEASKGINVHMFCTRLIAAEMTDMYENFVQAIGRVWARVNQKEVGQVYLIFVEGSTDHHQYKNLIEKDNIAKEFDRCFNYDVLNQGLTDFSHLPTRS